MQATVHIEHVARAGALVQPVHILGEDPDGVEIAVHFREDVVAAVRGSMAARFFQFQEIVPSNLWPGPEHGSGKGLLDGEPMRGCLLGAINAVTAPISGKSGIGRHPRARDEQQAAGPTHRLDDAVDGTLVIQRERWHCFGPVDLPRCHGDTHSCGPRYTKSNSCGDSARTPPHLYHIAPSRYYRTPRVFTFFNNLTSPPKLNARSY